MLPKHQRNQEILLLHIEGCKDVDIAKKYGISKQRVRTLVKKANLKPRMEIMKEKREAVAELVRDGYTVADISKLLGHSHDYILSVTADYGLTTNRHSRTDQNEMDAILRLAVAGGGTIYSLTKGDAALRERIYRLAKKRGIVLDNERSRERVRRETKRRLADGTQG